MSWQILLSEFVHYINILLSRLNNINMSNMRMILLLIICTLYRGCPFIRLCYIVIFFAASRCSTYCWLSTKGATLFLSMYYKVRCSWKSITNIQCQRISQCDISGFMWGDAGAPPLKPLKLHSSLHSLLLLILPSRNFHPHHQKYCNHHHQLLLLIIRMISNKSNLSSIIFFIGCIWMYIFENVYMVLS